MCRVDDDYKLIGGGAVIDPVEPSNFLTASYPLDAKTWFAAGKNHEIISPASITAFAYGLYDPDDLWDVQFVAQQSAVSHNPKVAVGLTDDYVLTGGGAIVHYTGPFPLHRRHSAAKLVSKDEARRIAANIAELPELLRKPD